MSIADGVRNLPAERIVEYLRTRSDKWLEKTLGHLVDPAYQSRARRGLVEGAVRATAVELDRFTAQDVMRRHAGLKIGSVRATMQRAYEEGRLSRNADGYQRAGEWK